MTSETHCGRGALRLCVGWILSHSTWTWWFPMPEGACCPLGLGGRTYSLGWVESASRISWDLREREGRPCLLTPFPSPPPISPDNKVLSMIRKLWLLAGGFLAFCFKYWNVSSLSYFTPNVMKQYRVADILGPREFEYCAFVFLAGRYYFIPLG